MAKTFTQISNKTFDLSYGYHDNVVVLTAYDDNGDEDSITFYAGYIDDFYDICVTFSSLFKSEL
jgi:hypothetical protein